ncbi:Pycsar system effector family protein [Marinomonas sp.]|uniref:Pycsar system effector family protein n=1 Tax=Marinomonas sp. TaxID=1904862 RepID=UPI003A919757
MSEDNQKKQSFLFEVLKRYDHYIATTNFKVALLMSFIGIVVFGVASKAIEQDFSKLSTHTHYFFIIVIVITIISSLISAFYLIRVIFPNTSNENLDKKSLIFFGDVSSCENGATGYSKKIRELSQEDLNDDLAKQTFILACVVSKKFKTLEKAVNIVVRFTIPSLILTLVTLVIIK